MNEKAFTLLEVVISIFVIVVLTGLAFVVFRGGEDNLALERAARKVAQDVRRSAEFALQVQQGTYCDPPNTGTLSGYGVYFDKSIPNSYLLFANCSISGSTPEVGYKLSGGDKDEDVERIMLDGAVVIKSVIVASGTDASIVFLPPDPTPFLCGNDPCNGANSFGSISIVLALANNVSVTKTININEGGFPDVD